MYEFNVMLASLKERAGAVPKPVPVTVTVVVAPAFQTPGLTLCTTGLGSPTFPLAFAPTPKAIGQGFELNPHAATKRGSEESPAPTEAEPSLTPVMPPP